ncbi:rod shape-determining protein MreD [Sphingomonas morindae]|uniref:Rod shape-determining protein MreD n=1 Tax=Sphingomonas morindae TaxID=1541170 RepID=A0ABY4X6X5_9SPHN|nr:rod shape-determining protein MreD [Sphingomonas morindae]USI72600.1 rod shape-determining protein MreD [Sphingomonas morindae]
MLGPVGRSGERRLDFRARAVPALTTLLGSATALLPVVALSPSWPPLGLLMLLAWRLLRPEIWAPWVALPLGLADDLITGQTLGTGMVGWTLCLLAIEAVEGRLLWRDYWQEWLLAAGLIAATILLGWAIARWTGGATPILLLAPQIVASILCFPMVSRLCVLLDRWRLAFGKIRAQD